MMKRMPYERPTDYYDEQIHTIDEQLCELIQKRKELSNNNPGFPPLEYIKDWATRFHLYEELLKSIFGTLWHEENFKTILEPDKFIQNLPVMRFVEKGNRIFSVVYIRQYNNVSVVNFNIDGEILTDPAAERMQHRQFRLFVADGYESRMISGGGSSEHYSYHYIVSPPLPDDLTGLELTFREYLFPANKPTGLEVVL